MIIKKLFYRTTLLVTIVSLASCEKFLDVQPRLSVSDEATIVDENSARTAVRGIYSQLQSNAYYGMTFQTLAWYSADNVQYVGSQTVNQQLTNHDVKADLGALSTSWSAIYNTINRANHVIARVPELPATATLTQALKDQLTGEAYFLRALAYFDLARTWGGVQLVTQPTLSVNGSIGIQRSTLAETYALVLSDLDKAEALLPNTLNRIRATRKTAWALKARLLLYLERWAEAEEFATKLISDNGSYALLTPYSSFFANNASNTRESVFELFYNTAVTNSQAGQWQPTTRGGVGWIRPNDAIVPLLTDPLVGGGRSALVQQVTVNNAALWFGNLFYRTNGTDPIYVIRIAELYLIRAEARAQQSKLEGALADLNAIKSRAGIPTLAQATQPELLLAIEKERRLELAFENHRWYDLIRTNRAQAVLGITNPNKLVLPIPFREILTDPALTQNPGYGQ